MSDLVYRLRRFWYSGFSRGTILTTLIVGSNLAVFVVQLVWHYYYRSEAFDDQFALSHQGLAAGHWWQLLSYGWLHSETLLIHILFNMLMVYNLGRELEWPLGPFRYLGLYLGSVLAAAGVWLLFDPHNQDAIEGASGAVFGLVAAFGFYDPKRVLRVWVMMVIPLTMSARTLALLLIGFEALCQARGWLPEIGHLAHLGGALFGFLFIQLWKRRRPPVQPFNAYKSVPEPPGKS